MDLASVARVSSPINVQNGGVLWVLTGFNQIAGINNDGTVSTGGGGNTLLIDGPMTGRGIFDIGAGGDELLLAPQSSATSSVNVDFIGGQLAHSSMVLDVANTFGGVISGFALNDLIWLRNQTVTGDTWTENGTGTGGTLAIDYTSGGIPAQESLRFAGSYGQNDFQFAPASLDGLASTQLSTDVPCFLSGTHILTATGERLVESLQQGDMVLTLLGDERATRPVKWIGRRRIDLTAHPRPETVAPVRVRRGAFADGMPHRDLLLSPDHAVFVDGKLICARQLINGTTIQQEKGWTSVEYFHVELDAHAILLAEGLPAESYLNTGNRGFFANSDAPLVLHPDLTDQSDYPTRAAASCVPFVSDEGSVRPIWLRLAERAAGLGQPAPKLDTTSDPELRIVANGRTLRPIVGEAGKFTFVLPQGTADLRLVSRAGSPTDARPWLDDRRQLGVRVTRITLRGASEFCDMPVDHPDLSEGWWTVERDGVSMGRWTDGDAALPLPAFSGAAMLEVRLGGEMTYLIEADAKIETGAERKAA